MLRAYTAAGVRAAERPLLDAGHGPALMRAAAWGLYTEILHLLRAQNRPISGARVVALLGKGNNGGDALWALSSLATRGAHIAAIPVTCTAEELHAEGFEAFRAAGGVLDEAFDPHTDVIIDAVLGTGFSGSFDLPEILGARSLHIPGGALVVACDIVSGLDAHTGEVPGAVLPADLTVTFGAPKLGTMIGAGAEVSGELRTIDIGLEPHLNDQPSFWIPETQDLAKIFTLPARGSHKYRSGVVGMIAGSAQYPGAAVLATQAAWATGIGMVRVVTTPESHVHIGPAVLARHPETIIEDELSEKVTGWVIGPGLGKDEDARQRFNALIGHLKDHPAPVVIDASGLELCTAENLKALTSVTDVVVTPHVGEFSRLVARLAPELEKQQLTRDEKVSAFAQKFQTTVVHKAADTMIATPQGWVGVHPSQGSQLATAGTGDTLAGILAAVVARSSERDESLGEQVLAGVYLHGAASVHALRHGPVYADALAPAVGEVLARIRPPASSL